MEDIIRHLNTCQPSVATNASDTAYLEPTPPMKAAKIHDKVFIKQEFYPADHFGQTSDSESAGITFHLTKNEYGPNLQEESTPSGQLQTNFSDVLKPRVKEEVDDDKEDSCNLIHSTLEIKDEPSVRSEEYEPLDHQTSLSEESLMCSNYYNLKIKKEMDDEDIDDPRRLLKNCSVILYKLPASQLLKLRIRPEYGSRACESENGWSNRSTSCDLNLQKDANCMNHQMCKKARKQGNFLTDTNIDDVKSEKRNFQEGVPLCIKTAVSNVGKNHKRIEGFNKISENSIIKTKKPDKNSEIRFKRKISSSSATLTAGKGPSITEMQSQIADESIRLNGSSSNFMHKIDAVRHKTIQSNKEKFACNHCSASFARKEQLRKHVITHTPEKTFPRNNSSKSFTHKSALSTHTKMDREEKRFSCSECSKQFTIKCFLIRHMQIHTGEKPFSCSLCTASFARKCNLKHHILTHSGDRPFSCTECCRSFTQKRYLKTHICTHSGDRPFFCTECCRSFTQKRYLKTHIRTHSGDRPFFCTECCRSFTQKRYLKTHICTHSGDRPFFCTECCRSFTQKRYLKTHIRTHSGERPFSCGHCTASFSRKATLKRHILTHTGERSFSCKACCSSFTQKSHLKTHMRTHSGERPFSCGHCTVSFSVKGALKKHILTHTGERPFS